jgi:hypothetical protein
MKLDGNPAGERCNFPRRYMGIKGHEKANSPSSYVF